MLKQCTALVALTLIIGCVNRKSNIVMDHSSSDPRWTTIDSLDRIGQYATAMELTDEVLRAARDRDDRIEEFRAWMYIGRFQQYTGIEPKETIAELEQRAANAQEPLRSLLHSVLGNAYWQAYEEDRWRILERTDTRNDPADMDTWSQAIFMERTSAHFRASLEARDTLLQLPVESLRELLSAEGERTLRPTVYDLLAHRALDQFTNSETRSAEPAWRYRLDKPADFALFEEFAFVPEVHRDSTSWELQAMRLFKDLTRAHLSDTEPDALVDLDLERLAFVRRNSVLPDKDSLYYNALVKLRSRLPKDSCWSEVTHAMAEWHTQQAAKYQRLAGDAFKHERDTAVALCDSAIHLFPGSFGAVRCAALRATILTPDLKLATEEAVLPDVPFKVSVQHTQIPALWWRIIPLPTAATGEEYRSREELVKLLKVKSLREGRVELPDHGDLNMHVVELPFEGLPAGEHVLLVSDAERFDPTVDIVVHADLSVTRIGLVERQLPDNSSELLVLDRGTGRPIQGALVKQQVMVRTQGNSRYSVKAEQNTDVEGRAVLPFRGERGSVRWEITSGQDRLLTGSRYLWDRTQRVPQPTTRTFLFTDRAIYRPGQVIHFKGIMIRGVEKEHTVLTNTSTTIALFDVNGEKVADLAVTTDAYGSFRGSFTAPRGALTGAMRLEEAHGSTMVQVEEYKRPTFEVTFDPVAGSPVVGEEATVTGRANSYAGVPLDGGTVQWRVTRTPRMPWWCGWHWRSIIPWGSSTELANGVAGTDAQGRFTIAFLAQADEQIPRAAQALFDYTVEASVTDISGETQSGTTQITVGQQRFQLELDLGESLSRPTADSLRVAVKNMNGEPLDIPVHVKIHRVTSPASIPYRQRMWDVPDGFVISKEEHDVKFPGVPFADEADPLLWPVESTVLDVKDANGNVALAGVDKWRVGDYRVELTAADPTGDTITVMKHVVLYDPDIQWTGFGNEAFHMEVLRGTVEPGEKAELLISSALPEASVLMEVERQGVIGVRRRFLLKNGQQKIQLPVQEADRGGFVVHFVCVERGRIHSVSQPITVPWSNKQLQVEWMSFRDRLLPGQEEEWRVKISGPKGEAVAAQLLTAMYDASLDQFVPHQWNSPNIWPGYTMQYRWNREEPFGVQQWNAWYRELNTPSDAYRTYPWLNTYGYMDGFYGGSGRYAMLYGESEDADYAGFRGNTMADADAMLTKAEAGSVSVEMNGQVPNEDDGGQGGTAAEGPPVVRSDFRETAFFFPDLLTDRDGSVILRFRTPDALTRWNVLGLAHTPELQFAKFAKEAVTQRPLMVVPNLPRTLRQGDRIMLTAKINSIEQRIEGTARMELFDPFTNADLNDRFGLAVSVQTFIAAPGESAAVQWEVRVPEGVEAVGVRITVKGGGGPMGAAAYADGEERVLPVLTDRVLVTESLPLPMRGAGTKQFTLEKLVNSGASSTLRNHRLELEFTPDPVWYAVQALPYLMEFPHECAEQVFSRYYSDQLAAHITEKQPRIQAVFAQWKDAGPDAFLSALEKNSELKGIVLEETPWVMDAGDEQERKKRIGVLFDVDRMSAEQDRALRQLMEMQRRDGAWSWFSGMEASRWVSQHIVAGMGHLEALGVSDGRADGEVQRMLKQAVQWLDEDMYADHQKLRERLSAEQLRTYRPGYIELHYLYARSYFKRFGVSAPTNTAITYYRERFAAEWLSYGLQEQAMIALALERFGDDATPTLILTSLKQRATVDDELGMYWKGFRGGMDRSSFPTETHALMIEAFHVVANDKEAVKDLRIHLLKLKQTTDWRTTTATAEAVYALLLGGDEISVRAPAPVISVGGKTVVQDTVEAGTGYFSVSWDASEITPGMGNVTVTTTSDRVAWGALHWQYFEQMDQVTPHESPFSLAKEVMLKQATDAGPQLVPVHEARALKPGDELVVRLVLRTDRWLDFVHLKDLRASALEPIDKLSGYRNQGRLGYYQSIKDASMHFFFDRIGPGTYVFEYSLRATHAGDLSNGITTAMCMYAPEFAGHSAGMRITIGERPE